MELLLEKRKAIYATGELEQRRELQSVGLLSGQQRASHTGQAGQGER